MVLKFFHLVLKMYGKWLLKMCGNPFAVDALTELHQQQLIAHTFCFTKFILISTTLSTVLLFEVLKCILGKTCQCCKCEIHANFDF